MWANFPGMKAVTSSGIKAKEPFYLKAEPSDFMIDGELWTEVDVFLQAQSYMDRQGNAVEIMQLYQREKVNPMAGCLPMIIQIPVFFALYKVLFITIEMRHAPFFGWVHDLSAPDPTTLFNLFGVLAWNPPSWLMIGAWPLIMGVTMVVQQKLNPPAADPVQEKMMMVLPIMFTVMLAQFPVGLVIYWAWNNLLTIGQQWTIMRLEGDKPQPKVRR
jgi:YidC/Oxa1 family membrane protein insertase